MNKTELITAFSKKTGRTKVETDKLLNEMIEFVTDTLDGGETIRIVGFMELGVKQHGERNGVNPSTKEKIVVPAKRVPYAKFGKTLKDMVK